MTERFGHLDSWDRQRIFALTERFGHMWRRVMLQRKSRENFSRDNFSNFSIVTSDAQPAEQKGPSPLPVPQEAEAKPSSAKSAGGLKASRKVLLAGGAA